ncbi:MAG: glycoside hydrolase family 28 protein, partial [Muribaculaceae bacterium]|nr:glycoside hydrolase family 28 protein [Muribaculaceae bacterium]
PTYPGGGYDLWPGDVEGFVEAPTSGLVFDTADDIPVRDCSVSLDGFPADRYAGFMKTINCRGVR